MVWRNLGLNPGLPGHSSLPEWLEFSPMVRPDDDTEEDPVAVQIIFDKLLLYLKVTTLRSTLLHLIHSLDKWSSTCMQPKVIYQMMLTSFFLKFKCNSNRITYKFEKKWSERYFPIKTMVPSRVTLHYSSINKDSSL